VIAFTGPAFAKIARKSSSVLSYGKFPT